MSASTGAINCKVGVFWVLLAVILLPKKCDACMNITGCRYFPQDNRYSCFQVLPHDENGHSQLSRLEATSIRIIEICNLTSEVLHLEKLVRNFPNVTNVTMWQGNVTKLAESFPPNNTINVLQLKNLTIEKLPEGFLNNLGFLEILNLSGNHLKILDLKMVEAINQIPRTYLAYNPWDCSLNLDWALKLNSSSVKDLEDLKCFNKPYPGKPLIPIARFKNNVHTNCPADCECWMSDVVRVPTTLKLEPIIEVNCSDRGFKELPSILPEETKILMLERNSISSLEPLITNPIYRGVQDLYLDNNLISSIAALEGKYWLAHFRVLSLNNNKLSQLPTYALDNALQQNPNMPIAIRIYLGNNPWRCDCVFTPGFQDMLRKYEMQVKDIEDIRCSYVEGDENSLTLIFDLSRSSVCRLPTEYSIQILDLLNGVLASLIVLILCKLGYDYYHFKKTGRLPWIVTKMP